MLFKEFEKGIGLFGNYRFGHLELHFQSKRETERGKDGWREGERERARESQLIYCIEYKSTRCHLFFSLPSFLSPFSSSALHQVP